MTDIILSVWGLGKRYRIGSAQALGFGCRKTLAGYLLSPFRYLRQILTEPTPDEIIWALKDVSFEVKRGEVLGIIGPNGAGKSTLLKILSRITEPTEGRAEIRGRVGSLLEVGTGFNPELTGRENIYLSGAIQGMRKAEIDRKFDEILDFAEIEKFIHTPVKRYSSGMYVRLAFAVAAHMEPEILLVDEVLAVGDASFQRKCLGKMSDVAREGRTVLLVSHNMASISMLCDRAIALREGILVKAGDTEEVIEYYLSEAMVDAGRPLRFRTERQGNGILRFTDVNLVNSSGESVESVRCGDDIGIEIAIEVLDPDRSGKLDFGLSVTTLAGAPLFLCNTQTSQPDLNRGPRFDKVVCNLRRLPLLPGAYMVNLNARLDGEIADYVPNAMQINVHAGDFYGTGKLPSTGYGAFLVDYEWSIHDSMGEGISLEL